MLNAEQYLLICLAEEAGEVAHEVYKGMRFGWKNRHPAPGHSTNEEKLRFEILDVVAVYQMANLDLDGVLHGVSGASAMSPQHVEHIKSEPDARHLLSNWPIMLARDANRLAQAAHVAIDKGLDEVWCDKDFTVEARLNHCLRDVLCMHRQMEDLGIVSKPHSFSITPIIHAKRDKVLRYLRQARLDGLVKPAPEALPA